jgi:hypothetical protein
MHPKHLLAAAVAALLLVALAFPVLAADPADLPHSGRVLIAIGGDIDLPVGDQADAVIVVDGTATIGGTVNAVFVVEGTLVTEGAVIEDIIAIRSDTTLGAGTQVLNDVRTLDGEVSSAAGVTVGGDIAGLEEDVWAVAMFVGAAAIILWIGFGVATLLAALALAGLAARQVRSAGALIGREPGKTLLAGLLGLVLPPLVAVLLFISVVGIPAGIGVLLVIWPALAFIGYLVAAIWIGERILGRSGGAPASERPYLAAVVGVLVVMVAGIVPLLTFVVSLFGLGAVIRAAWRTFRGRPVETTTAFPAHPAPMPG